MIECVHSAHLISTADHTLIGAIDSLVGHVKA